MCCYYTRVSRFFILAEFGGKKKKSWNHVVKNDPMLTREKNPRCLCIILGRNCFLRLFKPSVWQIMCNKYEVNLWLLSRVIDDIIRCSVSSETPGKILFKKGNRRQNDIHC